MSKIPPDFFVYPELLAFIFLPITWILLPVAGFHPELMKDYLPVTAFMFLANYQVHTFLFSTDKKDRRPY